MQPVLAKKPISPETTARKRHPIQSFLRRKVVPLAKGALLVVPAGIALWTLSTKDAIAQTKGEAKETGDKSKKELALGMPADTAKVAKGAVPVKNAQVSFGEIEAGIVLDLVNEKLQEHGFYYASPRTPGSKPNSYADVWGVAAGANLDKEMPQIGLPPEFTPSTKIISYGNSKTGHEFGYLVGPKGVVAFWMNDADKVCTMTYPSSTEIVGLELFSNGYLACMTNSVFFVIGPAPNGNGCHGFEFPIDAMVRTEGGTLPGPTAFDCTTKKDGGLMIVASGANWPDFLEITIRGEKAQVSVLRSEPVGLNTQEPASKQLAKQ